MNLNLFTKQINIVKETWPDCIYLNLDHARDITLIKKCIDLGWDMVMYDGSGLPLEDNIKNTKRIVDYAQKEGLFVEGEIDPFFPTEALKTRHPPPKTDIKKAKEFIDNTNIDYFAIALGTYHGYSPDNSIEIDYDLLDRASKELDVNLVLHGGSGLSSDTYKRCFSMKIKKINISTEIKQVYRKALYPESGNHDFDVRFLNKLISEKMQDFFLGKKLVLEGLT
jgi:fructose/tagatose bisphosphate aldolase